MFDQIILHNIALLDEIDKVARDWNPASILLNIAEIELIEAEIDRIGFYCPS